MTHAETLAAAGLTHAELSGGTLPVHSPIDGAEVARIAETALADMPAIIAASQTAFNESTKFANSTIALNCFAEGQGWQDPNSLLGQLKVDPESSFLFFVDDDEGTGARFNEFPKS